MTLVPATFRRVGTNAAAIPCQFNPTEYTLNKAAQTAELAIPGLDSPVLQFVRGQAETLTADLFFDTTDNGTGTQASAVTVFTDRVYELVKIDPTTHAPPVVDFSWGASDFPGAHLDADYDNQRKGGPFRCIVESVKQRFTLFSPSGIPLRATLTVSLREYKTLATQIKDLGLKSSDHTEYHVVVQADTLTRIAAASYGDPTQWRLIAEANSIDDPLALTTGAILVVPPVSS